MRGLSSGAAVCVAMVIVVHGIPAEEPWPMAEWPKAQPVEVGMNVDRLEQARDYALTGGGSGYVTRFGKLVMAWGDSHRRYDLKSTTKSIGVTALGLAIADGKIGLQDLASDHHATLGVPPESNLKTGWLPRITVEQLATQTAGFGKSGGYTPLLFRPGTKWSYSDGGPNWLAECITLSYRRDIDELMRDRIFTPLGIDRDDLRWRQNAYRPHKIEGIVRREFGSGISANVDAMARIGYLYLRRGKWQDEQLVPETFVAAASTTVPSVVGLPEVDSQQYGNASDHYGLLWWNNADGRLQDVPRDAFWSWGLYDSLIVVIPSLDVVVARAGRSWKRETSGHYDVLAPFLRAIAGSMAGDGKRPGSDASGQVRPPEEEPSRLGRYPPSPVILGVDWAPAATIIRRASGSDNWPITWGDDDRLYTAYGDGRGFRPFVEKKLSLGLATISGDPPHFQGENLRAPSLERFGDGRRGPKASGLLMVDGTLYAWVRNTGNSQLAWSRDHGRTWSWSPWRFTTSFGCPTFLNFGSNYAGARDEYVYVYSPDCDNAYRRADRMVLARVPKRRITDRDAYEFFVRCGGEEPVWTRDVRRRGSVFDAAGRCYRSSVSYNRPLGRYLWCQTGEGTQPRFQGGLAIYDAPEPWGPWTSVYYAPTWDTGPGETSSLPTKWMSADGRRVHLVFSGEDAFSVRRGRLLVESSLDGERKEDGA